MKIGVMLQSLHHSGGIGTYTRHIVKNLLALDKKNEYILIYPSFRTNQAKKSFGLYSNYENCTEVLSPASIPHYWDHVVVPRIAKKHGVDLLFNPYESIPLRGNFRKIFVLHNSERFIMPEVFWFSERYTGRLRMKALMRAADCIISVSHKVAEELVQATGLPESKFRVVHNAAGEEFQPVRDVATLERIREKYRLPNDFVLFVGRIYPQKNFAGLLEAFKHTIDRIPHQLVVAGDTHPKLKHGLDLIEKLNLRDRVQSVGWVGHDDLPALYSLATCFIIPSFHESCSVALLEALSCGCPVIASNAGGNPEVVGEAALLVDPANTIEIKDAMLKVLSDADLRQRLAQAGLARAQEFSWAKSAAQTLKVFYEFSGRIPLA
jgi:glycosyltransferase involved in cell wall biosynthesis